MIKKINKYINLSIFTSILFVLFGGVILLFPKTTLSVFSYTTALVLAVVGIYLIVLDIRTMNNLFYIESGLLGVLLLILGFIIIAHPSTLAVLLPVVLGIWFIVSSIIKFKFSAGLRGDNIGLWVLSLLVTILSVLCGVIFIVNPIESSEVITSSFGLIMIIYAVADSIEMIIFKRNINKIAKYVKEKIVLVD